MTETPIEDSLRHIADHVTGPVDPPPELLTRVRRRRRWQVGAAAGASAAAVAAVVTIAVAVAAGSSGSVRRHQPTRPGPHPTPATVATFAPLPAPAVHDRGEPPTFLAAIGAGAERLAVVDSRTGSVRHWLQQTGSQALMVFTADHRTGYQWDLRGCRYSWTAVDTRTGRTQPAFGGLGNLDDVALSATGERFAYVSIGRQQTVVVTTPAGRRRVPAGCTTARKAIVVTDRSTGATRQWALPKNYDQAGYLAFDAMATHLAFVEGDRVRLLDINRDATLAGATTVTKNLPRGCRPEMPAFRAGSNEVDVNMWCPSGSAVVGYDAESGRVVYRHKTGGAGTFLSYFSFDGSGRHLLYAVDGHVYAVEPGGDRHITDDAYQVVW